MPNKEKLVLAAVLFLGLILRIIGIGFGLPHVYHQDEPIVVNHALAIGVGGWNTGIYLPPQFASYFLFIFYAAAFVIGKTAGFFSGPDDFAVLYLKDPTFFYMLGRLSLGVLLGTLTVAVLARTGQRFFSGKAAILPAAFLAMLPMHVQHSHYIYVDIAVTLFVAAMFHYLLEWLHSEKGRPLMISAVFFGLAVSAKYTAVYFFPSVLLAHFLVYRGGVISRESLVGLAAFAFIALAVYAIISPFTFLDWPNFMRQVSYQSGARGFSGFGHHLTYSLANGVGYPLLLLSAAGMIWLSRKFKKEAVLLLFSLLVYYGVNVAFSQVYARYMMPVLPFLSLLGAAGCAQIAGIIRKKALRTFLMSAVFVSLLAPSAYSDWLFLREDTRTQCLKWFEQNVREGETVVVDNKFFAPRLLPSPRQIEENAGRLEQASGGRQAGKHDWAESDVVRKRKLDLMLTAQKEGKKFEIYVLSASKAGEPTRFLFEGPFVEPDRRKLEAIQARYVVLNYADATREAGQIKEALSGRWERAAVFSPYWGADLRATADRHSTTAAPDSQRELFRRSRPGPYLEVYKIKP